MATSGTYSFLMNRDSIISAALRTLEVVGAGDTVQPVDIANCAEALNIMVKAMVMDGLPLWCVQELTIPLVAGQSSYNVGPVSLQPRPLRILQAFLRSPTNNDLELQVVSRYDYNTLGLKTQLSQPNQLYYDPQLLNGIITVYNIPQDSLSSIHIVIQRQIQDFNLSTDNPDFPQEAFQMLKWCLADELSSEYGSKVMKIQVVAAKAKTYREAFAAFGQEQVSSFFLPSGRRS